MKAHLGLQGSLPGHADNNPGILQDPFAFYTGQMGELSAHVVEITIPARFKSLTVSGTDLCIPSRNWVLLLVY